MKSKRTKKLAVGMLITGLSMTTLGFGVNLFTLFNIYDRVDDKDCPSGAACNIDEVAGTLPLGKVLTYSGVALIMLGVLLLVYSLRHEDKK